MANYIIIDGELYHHGVKGMKWGVRKKDNRAYASRSKRRTKHTARKGSAKDAVIRLAKDPRVQIGVAATAGIIAGALGNMPVASMMATRVISKTLNYGDMLIDKLSVG